MTHYPLRLVAIAARADASWYQRLRLHLAVAERQGKIDLWHASQTLPTHDRWQECKSRLDAADLVLLFLSPDFLASPACQEQLQQVMPRLAVSVLLPLLVRPVDLSSSPLASIQGLPEHGRALVEWRDQDEAMLNIASGIRRFLFPPASEGQQTSTLRVMPVPRSESK